MLTDWNRFGFRYSGAAFAGPQCTCFTGYCATFSRSKIDVLYSLDEGNGGPKSKAPRLSRGALFYVS